MDDEKLVCRGLVEGVDWSQYDMEVAGVAHNGGEGLKLLEELCPDLIVTDMRMPVMDGRALIREVRKRDKNLPILVISGYDDSEYLIESIRHGVHSYLLKPIDSEELRGALSAIAKMLKESSKQQTLLHQASSMLQKTTLQRVFDGEILQKEFEEKAQVLGFDIGHPPYCPAFIEIDNQMTVEEGMEDLGVFVVENICNEILNEEQIGICAPYGKHGLGVFCHSLSMQRKQWMEDQFQTIDEYVLRNFGFRIDWKIGETVECLELIRESFQHAHTMLLQESQARLNQYSHTTRKVIEYVEQNYQSNLTLKEISEALFLNTAYLGQLFKKEYGCSFNECVNNYRVQRACMLLHQTNFKIYEVANMTGFPDSRYFISIFKKYMGKTPSEFRSED